MSTDKEAENRADNQPDYERPAHVIRPMQNADHDDENKLTDQSEQKSKLLRENVRDWRRAHLTPMNVLTFVIAAAAWAQFSATKGQLETMNRQLDEMRSSGQSATAQMWSAIGNMNWMAKSMDTSTKETQLSINSTKDQSRRALDATIDTLRTNERAWISVGSVGNAPIDIIPGRPFITNLGIINTGKTPARNVTARYRSAAVDTGKSPNFYDLPRIESVGVIGPGSWTHFGSRSGAKMLQPLGEKEAQDIRGHKLTVFVYGRIAYDDAFGFHHWNKYCYILDPDTRELVYCQSESQNDMDGELR